MKSKTTTRENIEKNKKVKKLKNKKKEKVNDLTFYIFDLLKDFNN